jgi:hypothetical protein
LCRYDVGGGGGGGGSANHAAAPGGSTIAGRFNSGLHKISKFMSMNLGGKAVHVDSP